MVTTGNNMEGIAKSIAALTDAVIGYW